jgi:hypothetical protein
VAALSKVSLALPIQADNTIGTRWRTPGSKGPPTEDLEWGSLATVAALIANQTTGSAFSHNVRQYLSGTNAATATISIVQVSGDNATSEGWAISSSGAGNNLTHPGSNTGSGFFILRATDGTGSVDSPSIGWAWVASATDTLAPTIPTGITITPQTNALDFVWSASQDPLHGSSAASGVKDYIIRRGGTTVATVNATSPGISPSPTEITLGSYSPSPSFSYSTTNGGRYTITSAGIGTHGTTTEQFKGYGFQVSGNFKARVKVVQFTAVGGYLYSTAGIMVSSRTQGQPFVYFYEEPIDGASRVQLKRRTTAGTNAGNVAANSVASYAYLQITRTGDSWRTEYSLDGGLTWNLNADTTCTLPTDVYVDLAVTSQVAGSAVTAIFEQFAVSNTSDQTYTLSSASSGTYTVSARDIALNESAQSTGLSGVPNTPPVQSIRFDPGHYGAWDQNIRTDTRAAAIPAIVAALNSSQWKDNANLKGMKVNFHWGALEQGTSDTTTTYSQGLADLRAIADAARNNGKKIMLSFLPVIFGGTGANLDPWLPNYIWNGAAQGYGWTVMSNGKIPRIWQQKTMDRLIALVNFYANADNGHGTAFKNDSTICMFNIIESSIAVTQGVDDYSISAWTAQLRRHMTAVRANAPNMPFRLELNFLGSNDNVWETLQHCVTEKFAVGGPDTIPSEGVQANRIYSGMTPDPEIPALAQTKPVVNLRGILPFIAETQTPSLGGHEGDWTASQLYTFQDSGGNVPMRRADNSIKQVAVPGVDPSYVVWAMKDWDQGATGGVCWSRPRTSDGSPSIISFINSISGAVPTSSYPTGY